MLHFNSTTCMGLGGTGTLLGLGCALQSAKALQTTYYSDPDGIEPTDSSLIQRTFTRIFGEPTSRMSEIARGVGEAVIWALPAMAFGALAIATLDPDSTVFPAEPIKNAMGLDCSCSASEKSYSTEPSPLKKMSDWVVSYLPGFEQKPDYRTDLMGYIKYQAYAAYETVDHFVKSYWPVIGMGGAFYIYHVKTLAKAEAKNYFRVPVDAEQRGRPRAGSFGRGGRGAAVLQPLSRPVTPGGLATTPAGGFQVVERREVFTGVETPDGSLSRPGSREGSSGSGSDFEVVSLALNEAADALRNVAGALTPPARDVGPGVRAAISSLNAAAGLQPGSTPQARPPVVSDTLDGEQ